VPTRRSQVDHRPSPYPVSPALDGTGPTVRARLHIWSSGCANQAAVGLVSNHETRAEITSGKGPLPNQYRGVGCEVAATQERVDLASIFGEAGPTRDQMFSREVEGRANALYA
jgi:hypothetical protein